MLKFKKIVSLLLAVLMVMSAFTVMTTAAGAVTYEDTKLYFDLSSTGWELGAKDKVGFYVFSAEYGELLPWGGKKLNGTDEGDGIWSYDPAAKGMDIKEGEQYKIIFTGAGNQTYDLIFDTTCYGHVAYCDDTIYENPVDSSKQTRAAFWKDMDATKYGPVLQISSIGTVVGTCPEEGKTPLTIFEDFLTNTLANARTYMVDTGKKTEQQLIDDIGEGLGLTKDDVAASIASTDTESTWSADASALPAAAAPETTAPETTVPETQAPTEELTEPAPTEPETQTIETVTPEPGEPTYYIVGGFTDWQMKEEYAMTKIAEGDSVKYLFKDLALASTDQFKVVSYNWSLPDPVQTWYPDGMGNNYGENGEITVAGTYDVLFDPNLDAEGEGWFYNCIKVKGMPALPTTPPETQAIETISPEPGEPTYYIVGNFTDWQIKDEYTMTKIADGDSVKYLFEDLPLTVSNQFKVVAYNWSLPEPAQVWYPDGMGNNYGENGEITADGTYDVYFDPVGATDGWFYNCIYVDGMPAPTQPAPTEPAEYKRAIDSMANVDDVVAEAGITDTFTVYFKMPTSGEHSWANEYNELDGVNWAGIYWWQGSMNLNPWPGAKMTLVDAEQGIFSANVPYESDELTNIIFNNAVDGGTDKTTPQYAAAQQTVNVNCQGADPEEFDTIPEGTATDNFDGCIFICKPAEVTTSEYSGKETFFGDWYFYYGDGCYGKYAMSSDHFTYVDEMCCNPDHHHDPLIPTEPESKDGYYVVGNFTDWAYKDEFKMTEGEDGIYTLATELTTLSRFKIVHVEGENVTWIPDGIGSDYDEITENGTYTVCFDPAFSHTDWYCDCITIELISAADFKLGDVDGDGDVTVVDATFIQRYATFVDVPGVSDPKMRIVADVDGDGDVTPVDATLVMRYATLVPVPYKIGEII